MLHRREHTCWIGTPAAILVLAYTMPALGGKPGGKPGGGGKKGPSYEIVRLDDVGGTYVEGYAYDVNNLGDVVGQVEDAVTSERRAAYWEVSGSGESIQSRLSPLTGGIRAAGINDLGEISGSGMDSYGQGVGLYWANAGAVPLPLLPLSENVNSYASAISNDGVIVGRSDSQAVAWRINWADSEPSVWGPLPLPALDDNSFASAISNNDSDGFASIVGRFATAVGQRTAAVAWTVQSLADGTLSVDPLPSIVEAGDMAAFGVNDSGTISGWAGWPSEAIVWTEVASRTLHRAKDASAASAQDINNNGTIVGWGGSGIVDHGAVVWPSADEKMVLLDKYLPRKSPPFVSLKEALAINESGQIAGYGWDSSSRGAFLAIPTTGVDSRDGVAIGSVPEPSAFVLSTLTMMGVGLGRRWRGRGKRVNRTASRT